MTINVGDIAQNAAAIFILFALISTTAQRYFPKWPFPGSGQEWGILAIATALISKV